LRLSIELGSGAQKVIADLQSLGRDIGPAVSEGLGEGVKLAADNVVANHISGQDLKVHSGDLRRATKGWLASQFDGVVGVWAGEAVDKYKWLMGTKQKTIVPTAGHKFLAIPMPFAQTAKGVKADYLPPTGTSLKNFIPGSFILKTKMGGLFIALKTGKTDRSIKLLFMLKKSVVVTGSGALFAGTLEKVDAITQSISDKIDRKI